ncbi:hypothetical protein ScPMuIL_004950 [Solemya velum]
MLPLFILAISLSGSLAVKTSACCTATEWEAVVLQVGGTVRNGSASALDGYFDLLYDFDMKRITRIQHPVDKAAYRTITDYNTRKTYIITAGATGLSCSSHDLSAGETMTPNCIPANSTHMGTHYLGASADAVLVNSWRFIIPGGLTLEITVTEDDCTPVLDSSFYTATGIASVTTRFYTNFKKGISDIAMTQIPSQCTRS